MAARLNFNTIVADLRDNSHLDFFYVRYPNSTAIGKWAWTCMSLGKAKKRLRGFEDINQKLPS